MTNTITRHDVLAVLAAADTDALFIEHGIDPEAADEIIQKLVDQTAPKPKVHGTSAAHKRNLALFRERVAPYMELVGGATTAADIAHNVDGLPIGAQGVVTTQAVTAILRAGMTENAITLMDNETAAGWRKEHKVKGKATVYVLAR